MKNLWPADIGYKGELSPVTILKQQASLLGQKTKNLVKAKVEFVSSQDCMLAWSFCVIAPALDNYKYQLFVLKQDIGLGCYPVTLIVEDDKEASYNYSNEDKLLEGLRDIFDSYTTRTVISNLLAHVKI